MIRIERLVVEVQRRAGRSGPATVMTPAVASMAVRTFCAGDVEVGCLELVGGLTATASAVVSGSGLKASRLVVWASGLDDVKEAAWLSGKVSSKIRSKVMVPSGRKDLADAASVAGMDAEEFDFSLAGLDGQTVSRRFSVHDGLLEEATVSLTGEVFPSVRFGTQCMDSLDGHGSCVLQDGPETVWQKIMEDSSKPGSGEVVEVGGKCRPPFSQYWNSLPEENRGEYFGYVLSKLYGRDLEGYGIFRTVIDHPCFKGYGPFEDFERLLLLRSELPPPWATSDDLKWECEVASELRGYLHLICQAAFRCCPVMELVCMYYRDMPCSAGRRLSGFMNRMAYHMFRINSKEGNVERPRDGKTEDILRAPDGDLRKRAGEA